MAKGCPFCTNAEIRARRITGNKHVWVFPTNIPIVPGHVLIAPVRHVGRFEKMTAVEQKALFAMLAKVKNVLAKVFKAKGFNIAWNEGEVAGQSVPHFHLHVLPRKPGDSGITEYEPRKFLYRPGSREVSPEAELRKVADTIRKLI